ASTYERLLAAAEVRPEELGLEADDLGRALRENLREYARALVALGRSADVRPLLERCARRWDGAVELAAIAFEAGELALAELAARHLVEVGEPWWEHEEAALLARIVHGRGERAEAERVLLEALAGLRDAARDAARRERRRLD